MKCPQCQFDSPAGMKFCGQCGAKLALRLPAVRHRELLRASSSAGNAASPLAAPGSGAGPASARRSPRPPAAQSYTPPHLAEPDPPVQLRPRRGAQAGHGPLLRPGRLDGPGRAAGAGDHAPAAQPVLRAGSRARSTATRGRSTSSWATASWRCSGPPSPMRTMPGGRCSRPWGSRSSWPSSARSWAGATGWSSRSAWGSTPAGWWSAASATISGGTTRRSATRRTSRPVSSSSPSPGPILVSEDTSRLPSGLRPAGAAAAPAGQGQGGAGPGVPAAWGWACCSPSRRS